MARVCKTPNTEVTLFTTPEIFSLVESHLTNKDEYRIVLKEDSESINDFLRRVQEICDTEIDVLFVNTIQESCKDLPHYFKFKPRCRMVLTVHDANTWLNQRLTVDVTKPVRTIDTFLSTMFIKKNVLPKFDAVNVIYPPIKDYIITHKLYEKPVFTLPFTFFNESTKISYPKPDEKMQVVVPGEIIQARRDHETVLDAFEQLLPHYSEKVSLCLLGRPRGGYGQQIINRCKALKTKGYDVTWFDAFVPEETYDTILRGCSLVIAPIKLETTGLGVIKETFGKTKASGAPFDAIQYAKPLVVPSGLQLLKETGSSTLQYTDVQHLVQILRDVMETKGRLEELQHRAQENSQKFSLDVLQKYFENEVLKTLM